MQLFARVSSITPQHATVSKTEGITLKREMHCKSTKYDTTARNTL